MSDKGSNCTLMAETNDNPYASPALVALRNVRTRIGWRGAVAQFVVDDHLVTVQWSGWRFRETYTVDDEVKLHLRSFLLWGERQFGLHEKDERTITVRYQVFPIWKAQAFVNDQLVAQELFPRLRILFNSLYAILAIELLAALALSIRLFAV